MHEILILIIGFCWTFVRGGNSFDQLKEGEGRHLSSSSNTNATEASGIVSSAKAPAHTTLKNKDDHHAVHSTPTSTGVQAPTGGDKGGILSRLFYLYATPLIQRASHRELDPSMNDDDLLQIPIEDTMGMRVPELQRIYNDCRSNARKDLTPTPQVLGAGSIYPTKGLLSILSPWKNALEQSANYVLQQQQVTKSESFILAQAIFQQQKGAILKTGILRLITTIIQAMPALLVAKLLKLIEEQSEYLHTSSSTTVSNAVFTALALVGVLLLKMIVENQYHYFMDNCALQVRGCLSGLIFDKSLRLSDSSSNRSNDSTEVEEKGNQHKRKGKGDSSSSPEEKKKKYSKELGTGGVLNLMQSDALTIEMAILQLHTIWDGILQITIYTVLLYRLLGTSVLYGLGLLLLQIPTNGLGLRVLSHLTVKQNKAKEGRIQKTTEAIRHMKLLKLQAWDKVFENDIGQHREEELARHKLRGTFRAFNSAITNAIPAIILVVTLAVFKQTGRPIVASEIFTAISLFNQLRFPLFFYPVLINAMANGSNSLKRISSYLCQEELVQYVQKYPKVNGGRIVMNNGNFLWSAKKTTTEHTEHKDVRLSNSNSSEEPEEVSALREAEVNIEPGEFVAVVGPVASGKSCLIKALLGELHPKNQLPTTTGSPEVSIFGDVCFCAQEAWLSKGTIREAIVFGREYNKERYLSAIYDAGLDQDIADYETGKETLTHDTQVGEGGSFLSGGQRARVQLARAFYGEEGVCLLDDPLSALDASVGATVFERMMKRLKERNAAVIFVTNDPFLPRRCDRVILMGSVKQNSFGNSCSQIVDCGTYDELTFRGHVLSEKEGTPNLDIITKRNDTLPVAEDRISDKSTCSTKDEKLKSAPNEGSKDRLICLKEGIEKTDEHRHMKMKSLDEMMKSGVLPLSTYTTYLKAVKSPLAIVGTLACVIMVNGCQFLQQYMVARWADEDTMTVALGSAHLNSLVYAAASVSVFLFLRGYMFMYAGSRASQFLHSRMLKALFVAPMDLFDRNPSGVLLSRFGKEIETVDRSIPDSFASLLYCGSQILMTFVGLAGVVTPKIALPLAVIGIMYNSTMSKFRPATRDLKRYESKSRSPISTHFGEALRGAETIRSFHHCSKVWSSTNKQFIDKNLSAHYTTKAFDRWLSIRLESLGNLVVLSAAFAAITMTNSGNISAGNAGWGLTQALSITSLLAWTVRIATELESQMMSVTRVLELANTGCVDKEVQGGIDRSSINLVWPKSGAIAFKNVSVRYNVDSPLVLKNVSISVPPGSTLGVVGRTGSGKSSLLLALFRITELEEGGSIEIDGVDIRSIPMHTLRENLSIIPQDPVFFAGTVMYNLDATGKCTEEDAWEALEIAAPDLALQFKSSKNGLYSPITENGNNFSSGERQLLCLARALLRKSKILVLDEATSSVDSKTDAQVQETIRREFVNNGISVITVAHRLDTILGSDKILVLGDGEVMEYGSPNDLLKLRNGTFRQLVDKDTQNKAKGMLKCKV